MADENTNVDAGQQAATQDGATQGTQTPTSEQPTYTQADLDRLVNERVKSHMDRSAAKAKEAEDKRKAELEKKQLEEQGKYEELKKLHEQEIAKMRTDMQEAKRDSALKVEALSQGIKNAKYLSILAPAAKQACLNEDGTVNAEAVSNAIATMKESDPDLFKSDKQAPTRAGQPTTGSAAPSTTPAPLNAQQIIAQRLQHQQNTRNMKPAGFEQSLRGMLTKQSK